MSQTEFWDTIVSVPSGLGSAALAPEIATVAQDMNADTGDLPPNDAGTGYLADIETYLEHRAERQCQNQSAPS